MPRKFITTLSIPIDHDRFYGEVMVRVRLDGSGDHITPDGPAEFDILEAAGQYAPAEDADLEYVMFEGADVPEFLATLAADQAEAVARSEMLTAA